ncbi:hypothetical protein DT076_16835 [Desertihabitans brevis]|uniref:GIY-YIG domain-containing protein n=1 Tax=Desertihabitans brevis TaxID=2268447 RepID=A0A367YTF6_9ACTN|nr:hypothetical protein [Desertihabitans brevis]RCK68312.1 hypothetical protein DT076_16835 [Desertihabitans brevis]
MTTVRDTFVYRVYDADDRLLYVGRTRAPRRRRWQHEQRSPWIEQAHRCVLRGPFDAFDAGEVEQELIACLLPLHNRHHLPHAAATPQLEHLFDLTVGAAA